MNDDNIPNASDFRLIGELSKEDLIEEVLEDHRRILADEDIINLKQQVIQARLHKIQERLIREAGLKKASGFNGNGFIGFEEIEEE